LIFPEAVGPPLFLVVRAIVGFTATSQTTPLSLINKVPAVKAPVAVAVYFPVVVADVVVTLGCVPATPDVPVNAAVLTDSERLLLRQLVCWF
jgi:hypothetical protein